MPAIILPLPLLISTSYPHTFQSCQMDSMLDDSIEFVRQLRRIRKLSKSQIGSKCGESNRENSKTPNKLSSTGNGSKNIESKTDAVDKEAQCEKEEREEKDKNMKEKNGEEEEHDEDDYIDKFVMVEGDLPHGFLNFSLMNAESYRASARVASLIAEGLSSAPSPVSESMPHKSTQGDWSILH